MALVLGDSAPEVSLHCAGNVIDREDIRSTTTNQWLQLFCRQKIAYLCAIRKSLCQSWKSRTDWEVHFVLFVDLTVDMAIKTWYPMQLRHIFSFTLDKRCIIGMLGNTYVSYANVTSGDKAIRMTLCVSGGCFDKFECRILIGKNVKWLYPIRNLPEDVPGICHRSHLKA